MENRKYKPTRRKTRPTDYPTSGYVMMLVIYALIGALCGIVVAAASDGGAEFPLIASFVGAVLLIGIMSAVIFWHTHP